MAPVSDRPLYNSRIFDSYLKLLRKKHPHVDVSELLSYADMQLHEVLDPGHWFSQRQVDLFHDKLVLLTGDPGFAREAGRYAASSDALGPLRSFMLGLVGPEYLFRIINKLTPRFSRSSRCVSRKTGPYEMELIVTFEEGVRENPRQCENRIGFFEAAFLVFGYDFPQIRHSECIFNGNNVCRYLISWRPSLAARLVLARRLVFLVLLVALIAAMFGFLQLLSPVTMGALVLYLALTLLAHHFERKGLLASLASMRDSGERLLGQLQENYDSALMINEIGKVISTRTELDDILSSVNQLLLKRLGYGRGIILLADDDCNVLELKACFGFDEEQKRRLELFRLPLKQSEQPGVLVSCFLNQQPMLVNDIAYVKERALPENFAFFVEMGVKSFICAPIVCEGESLGVLAVDDAMRERELLQSDLNLIQGVAPVIGIAISNAMRLHNERSLSVQLRKASEQLERRVAERTAELRQANQELEFLYDSVSHDLRTPLRIIYGYGELLLDGYGEVFDQTAREYLGCIMSGGERMEATLDRMLDLSEIRQSQIDLQPVDLSRMARSILADLRIVHPARPLIVEIQEDVVVTGDERLLTSVMENLIGNAWKYSAGKPESRISFGMRDGVVYVADNGDGFDMAQAEKLFLPFQRLHDDTEFAGHGFGLSMVQRIVERLGGKVWGEGKPGEGATFYFTLAGGNAAGAGAPPPESIDAPPGPLPLS